MHTYSTRYMCDVLTHAPTAYVHATSPLATLLIVIIAIILIVIIAILLIVIIAILLIVIVAIILIVIIAM